MESNVVLESRLGIALPVATTTLPRWHQELLMEPSAFAFAASQAAFARRKRQRFGLSDLPSRVSEGDRFIPSRRTMDIDYCSLVMETSADEEDDSIPQSSDTTSPSTSTSPSFVRTNDNVNQMENLVRYQETLKANLLFQTPPRKNKTLLRLYESENASPYAQQQFSSPTSVASHPSLQIFGSHDSTSRSRHIPTSPTRILDAPELRDDYYLNLVSWGDHNVLAVALDRVVYLYNTDTGAIQEIKACTTRGDYVTSVAWIRSSTTSCTESSIDSNKLAIGTYRSELQVWDTTIVTKVRSLGGHRDRIGALAWNGGMLTSGSRDAQILHHDLRVASSSLSGPAGLMGHQQEICGLAWSPDGKTLASGGNDNCLCLWDATMVSAIPNVAPRERLLQHRAAVKALAWCPWERHLLASGGGTADRTIKFWYTGTARLLNSVPTGSQVCGLVWSKTERELLSSHGFSQNELCLWKYPSMVRLREFTGHTARVLHMAMSPDGSSVVSAAADETLRFWNVFSSAKDVHTPSLLHINPRRHSLAFFSHSVIR